MSKLSDDSGNIPAARRGQIVQRVLVEGWSPAQTAAFFSVSERRVVRWVAAYRRHGMASLRNDAGADHALRRWARRLRMALLRGIAAEPQERASAELAPFVVSRHRRRHP